MRRIAYLLSFAFFPLFANNLQYEPWFTGPFLAPSAVNMSLGHPSVEPSLTVFRSSGIYDSHGKIQKYSPIVSINPYFLVEWAVTEKFGVELLAASLSSFQKGKSATYMIDANIYLGYQISNDDPHSWVPNCRFLLQEIVPTGHYQKFNPEKTNIEGTGYGSFQTGPTVAVQKLFDVRHHPLSLQWSFTYFFPTAVHVKGFNTYGGGYGTRGKVRPGQNGLGFFSGEYSINQRWGVAFDTQWVFRKRSNFSGKKGMSALGDVAAVGLPPSFQLSFAPELEYHISSSEGLIGGFWCSVCGKNSLAFSSTFLAYYYVF